MDSSRKYFSQCYILEPAILPPLHLCPAEAPPTADVGWTEAASQSGKGDFKRNSAPLCETLLGFSDTGMKNR